MLRRFTAIMTHFTANRSKVAATQTTFSDRVANKKQNEAATTTAVPMPAAILKINRQKTQHQPGKKIITRKEINRRGHRQVEYCANVSTSHWSLTLGSHFRVNGGVNGGKLTKESLSFIGSVKEMYLTIADNSQCAGKDQGVFDAPVA